MTGLPGTDLDDDTLSLIENNGISNFILFRRNACRGQAALTALVKKLCRVCIGAGLPEPIIATDQEGGEVQRLGPPHWQAIPSNRAATVADAPETSVARQAETAAEILSSSGINMNLAPVLDIASPDMDAFLENRCYGTDPAGVSRAGDIYIRTIQARGIAAAAKHFPGIGRVKSDPHYNRPVVTCPPEILLQETAPFQTGISSGVMAVMTSHVIFTGLDPHHPATFSRIIARDLLRRSMGFKGVLFTDDLEMAGIALYDHIGDAAVKAFVAGHDILLICHRASKVREVLEALDTARRQGILTDDMIQRSLDRIGRLRKNINKTCGQQTI